MKKISLILLFFLILIFLYLSFFYVKKGEFALCGKKIYYEGIHFKPFFKKVYFFKEKYLIKEKKEILTKEGAKINIKIEITFSPDKEKIWQKPEFLKGFRDHLNEIKIYDSKNFKKSIEEYFLNLPVKDLNVFYSIEGELPFEIKEKFKPTGKKIFLFALDALDWQLLDPLVKEGKMPNFKKLKEEGAWTNLISYKPVLSPIIWTSIATSRPPEEHGILEFTIKDPYTQEDVPVTSNQRNVPAIWNILSAFGLKSNIVGWWATFPAEKINGNIISERLFFHLFGIETPKKAKGNTYPEELEKKYENEIIKAEDIKYEEISKYIKIKKEEYERLWEMAKGSKNPFENPVNHLRKILSVTHSAKNITLRLLKEEDFDFFAFYLEGTDTVAHRFAHCLPPKLSWVPDEEYEMGKEALIKYYELMDEILGEILKFEKENWIISVVSDHGFYTLGARPQVRPDDFGAGASQWHRMIGVWIIKGKGIKKGEFTGADIYDITPTLLSILGVPLSKEMKGKPITEIFQGEFPVNHIDSYEFIPRIWKEEKALVQDKERIKELQALGYISPSPKKEEKDFTYYYNLGTTYFEAKEYEKAEQAYKKALEIYPEFSLALAGLSNVYEKTGKYEDAYFYAKKAYVHKKDLAEGYLIKFVEFAINSKNQIDAYETLKNMPYGWEKTATYWSSLGLLKESINQDPFIYYIEAIKINPAEPVACEKLLGHFLKIKDFDSAAKLLKNAYDSSRGNLALMNSLGVVCLKNGQGKIAEDIFRSLLKSNPDEPKLLGNLSIALNLQGKYKEAEEFFKKAIKLNPSDPMIYYNFGMGLEEGGKNKEAYEYFLKAKNLGLSDFNIYNALGRTALKNGNKIDAIYYFKESLKKNPNQKDLKKLLSKLERN